MKHITVGIITFNGAHRVHNCLQSIAKWNGITDEQHEKDGGYRLSSVKKWADVPDGYAVDFLLIDDGSHGEHVNNSLWVSKYHNIPVIFHETNMGISKSWNDIAVYGNSEIVVLLNDDILVSPHWLKAMTFFLEENPRAGAAGWNFYFITDDDVVSVLNAEEPIEINRDPIDKRLLIEDKRPKNNKPGRIMAATGSCFAFKQNNFKMIGGFDENYKSFYEETSFGTSLAEKGLPSFMLPYPLLYHQWSATFSENAEVLNPAGRMHESRKHYRKKWGGDTDYTHPKFMDRIEPFEVTWLDENLKEQSETL